MAAGMMGDISPSWRPGSTRVEQTIFIICMFVGVTAVALIACALLAIVLGHIKVWRNHLRALQKEHRLEAIGP
jgi:hypothetical protein